MADDEIFDENAALEMDEVLENITFYAFNEAKENLEVGKDVIPFTVIVEGDQMFVENYPYDDVESCRHQAELSIKTASSFATHYAFCYDGFLMTDTGQLDALIVECAERDMDNSYIIAMLYTYDDGSYVFEKTPAYVDKGKQIFDRAAVEHAEAEDRTKNTKQLVDDALNPPAGGST